MSKIHRGTKETLIIVNLFLGAVLMTGMLIAVLYMGALVYNVVQAFEERTDAPAPIEEPLPPPEPVPGEGETFDPSLCDEGQIHDPTHPCYDYWNEQAPD